MATRTHTQRVEPTVPYSLVVRRERSRELAQKRRTTYKSIMNDLAQELPFSKDVISQVDYNSRLRLALCYLRMKSLMERSQSSEMEKEEEVMEYKEKPILLQPGQLQDLMAEALDGFMMVTLLDGTIVYLSESVHKHLGLFQSEHIGYSMYDLILEEDYNEVKAAIAKAETSAMARLSSKGATECSFFCRMKCSRFKIANTVMKSPGYKLVFVSGRFKLSDSDPFLVAVVRPVSPPSILELRMEGNMFVTHYSLDFRCTFYDGRLRHLLGFSKNDLVGHIPFEFHHHEDMDATLECSRGVQTKGEGLSGYYRFLSQFGFYVWIQSRATLMFDSRTGKPSYIVCMNFIISKEAGERDLALRRAITTGESKLSESGNRSHDPFPVPTANGKSANPFEDASTKLEDVKPTISPVPEEPSSTSQNHTAVSPPPDGSHSSSISGPSSISAPSRVSSPSSVSTASSISQSSVPNLPPSVSTGPEECTPDSTTSVSQLSLTSSQMSSAGRPSDPGYHSGSMSSMGSACLFSPSFTSVGSSEPDTNSLLRRSLDSSPEHQLSLESPLSVFSPRSVSHTPRTIQPQQQPDALAMTYSANTAKKAQLPLQVQSSPSPSITQQYTRGASFSEAISTTSNPMGFAGPSRGTYGIQEQKYQPGLHSQVPFPTAHQFQNHSSQAAATNQMYQNAGQILPQWIPSTFIKQEEPNPSCCQQSSNMQPQANSQRAFVPGASSVPQMLLPNERGYSASNGVASVIVIDPDIPELRMREKSSNSLPVLDGEFLDFIEQLDAERNVTQTQYTHFMAGNQI